MALPGLMMPPGLMGGSAITISSVTLFDYAESSGATIAVPVGVQSGDLLLLHDRAGSGDANLPSGFTQITNYFHNNSRQIISFKVADGAEGGTNLTGQSGSFPNKLLLVFRGDLPITTAGAKGFVQNTSSSDPAPIIVLAASGASPLLVLGMYLAFGSGDTVEAITFSPSKQGEISNSSGAVKWAWEFYQSNPQDTTVDMGNNGNTNYLMGFYLELEA